MRETIINNHNNSNKNMKALLYTITIATLMSHDPSMVPTLNYGLGHKYFKYTESIYSLNTLINAIVVL